MVLSLAVWAGLPASALAQSAPAAPSGLAGTVVGPTELKLDWVDNSLDETGFRVERSDNGGAYASLVTLGADAITYSDTTVVGDALYSYRVFAVGAGGDSNPSNVFSGYTADTVAPPKPTLRLPANGDQLDTHNVHFEWDAVSDLSGVTYNIVVTDMDHGVVLYDVSGITQTSIDFLLYDAYYEWHVTATDGAGHVGAVSDSYYCLVVAIDALPPDTVVTAPNGGEVLEGGSIFAITWYALDQWTTSTPDLKVELLFSRDNGDNWEQIVSLDKNLGAFAWHVPNINCDEECLIRVVTQNEKQKYGSDDSDFAFSIVSTSPSSQDSISLSSHNRGRTVKAGSKQTIKWNSAIQNGDVSIKLFKGDRFSRTIAKRTPDDGSFTWKVPSSMKGGKNFSIRVKQLDTPTVVMDDCNKPFKIE